MISYNSLKLDPASLRLEMEAVSRDLVARQVMMMVMTMMMMVTMMVMVMMTMMVSASRDGSCVQGPCCSPGDDGDDDDDDDDDSDDKHSNL